MRIRQYGALACICVTALCCGLADAAEHNPWTFVNTPGFFNFEVPEPWPQWDDAVNWRLEQFESPIA